MVQYLALAGANRFWEHILLEPLLEKSNYEGQEKIQKSSKKPNSNSPLHSSKAEFIREKYLFHGFFKRPQVVCIEDLNLQLHASVRTAVLETSLYLLALGAEPNFIHPTKGTSPIHVACQYEQVGQLELLIAYGADVCIRSINGISPLEVALDKVMKNRSAIEDDFSFPWSPLIECILSTFYELTDGLSFYLCGRVPDHRAAIVMNGRKPLSVTAGPSSAFYGPGHFLIGSSGGGSDSSVMEDEAGSERARLSEAKSKLQQLENPEFEDLCIDVYDEAERRLTNKILEPKDSEVGDTVIDGMLPPHGRPHSVAAPSESVKYSLNLFFLSPNAAYSSVRNQARQKIGRLSPTEFHALVVDVLTEAAGRLVPLVENSQVMMMPIQPQPKRVPQQHNYISYELPPPAGLTGERYSPRNFQPNRQIPMQQQDIVNDDPVYDQVASEQDTTSQRSPNRTASLATMNSNSTSFLNGSITPNSNTKMVDLPLASSPEERVGLIGLSISVQNDAGQEKEREKESTQDLKISPYSNSPGSCIDSKPGHLPGSRRLHLPHTGRLLSNRQSSTSAERRSVEAVERHSVEVQVSQPCNNCLSFRNSLRAKVDQLQATTDALQSERSELTARNEQLEGRVHELETTCEQLKEANEGLKAALSAGMVMSHQRSDRSTPATKDSHLQPASFSPGPISANESSPSEHPNEAGTSDFKKDEDEEDYSYNDDVQSVRAGGSGGAYSMGNECLDSGILLRQGIWGTPVSPPVAPLSEESRILSKATLTSKVTPATSPSVVKADHHSPAIGLGAQRSYVNLKSTGGSRQMPNKPAPRDSPRTRITEVNGRQQLPTHHEDDHDLPDDYTAPNETGSPSPAPLLPVTTAHFRTVTNAPLWSPPTVSSNNRPHLTPKGAEGSDYVNPGSSPHLQYKSSNSTATEGDPAPPLAARVTPPQWKQPPYERVVRGVECIIVRIRGLLDAANSRQLSSLARSSQGIQAAVQDLVVLFPPISKCHEIVGGALSSLMSNSQKLRLYCERKSGERGTNGGNVEPANPLITFAHEIASAAKTILTFFQSERNN